MSGLLAEMADLKGCRRVVPMHVERMLSDRDQVLNRMPPEDLAEMARNGEVDWVLDRSRALMAAAWGYPASMLGAVFGFVAAANILVGIAGAVFIDLWMLPLGLAGAFFAFRLSWRITATSVRRRALEDPEVLRALMAEGVIWFQIDEWPRGR